MSPNCHADHLHLNKQGIAVTWLDHNEGWYGEYDPGDPTDDPLLRFAIRLDATAYRPRPGDPAPDATGWYAPKGTSFCTVLSARLAPHRLRRALEIIHETVQRAWPTPQHALYRLIWLDPVDLDPAYEETP